MEPAVLLPDWVRAGGVARARLIDLSHPITEATAVYPGDPQPRIFPATTIAEQGYNLSHVHLGTQTGTHIDAPFHFHSDGATVDTMPLSMTVGPGVVIPAADKGADEQITPADMEPYLDRLAPGKIVVFATGWYRRMGTEEFFRHPYLAARTGELLLAAGVRTIAVDTLNADATGGDEFPIHEMFAGAGAFIAENLAYADKLDPTFEPLVVLLPLNLVGCDGAPVRAAALEPMLG